jgi:hypothetical protein
MTNIVEWAQSDFGFYVDRRWDADAGGWVLERAPIRLAQYHADILAHCFTPNAAGRLPYSTIAWCEPAKSGKSAIAGLVAEYAGLHFDGDVILASNKQRQAASLMFRSMTDSISANPHLPNIEPGKFVVEFSNGNVAKAIASSSRSEAGARFSLACFDELWGYFYTDARRLWAEFKTDPTRLVSMKFAIGYAGYTGESDLWHDLLQSGLAGEPVPELAHIGNGRGEPACWRNGHTFVFWSHECKQPWQTVEWIEEQQRALRPAQFARMILTDFAENEGEFVAIAAFDALIDPECRPVTPGDMRPLWLGADAATRKDHIALVGCTWNSRAGRVELAYVREWRPKLLPVLAGGVDLDETIGAEVLRLHRQNNVRGVFADPWQMASLINRWQKAGVRVHGFPQTGHRVRADQALYDAITSGTLTTFASPALREAIRRAAAKETVRGLRLTKRPGDDLAVALSMAHYVCLHRKAGGVDDGAGDRQAETEEVPTCGTRRYYVPPGTLRGQSLRGKL